jgi:hypothetical protein
MSGGGGRRSNEARASLATQRGLCDGSRRRINKRRSTERGCHGTGPFEQTSGKMPLATQHRLCGGSRRRNNRRAPNEERMPLATQHVHVGSRWPNTQRGPILQGRRLQHNVGHMMGGDGRTTEQTEHHKDTAGNTTQALHQKPTAASIGTMTSALRQEPTAEHAKGPTTP